MKPKINHEWNVSFREAREIQLALREKVLLRPFNKLIRNVIAVDVSYSKYDMAGFAVLGQFTVKNDNSSGYYTVQDAVFLKRKDVVRFPYVTGYLSFREIPILLPLFEKIEVCPDLILVDGAGIAHPRGLGLAAHIGVIFDLPTIGCAKSRLIGEYDEPEIEKSSKSPIWINGKQVGMVFRSKRNVRPLFISPGNLCDFDKSVRIISRFCTKYRLPDPLRQVDSVSKEFRRQSNQ